MSSDVPRTGPDVTEVADVTDVTEVAAIARTARARLGPVTLVAVDGPSGAGKSTFARTLVAKLRADAVDTGLISTDDFATWEEPVAWWPRLAVVLDRLAAGLPGRYRRVRWIGGVPEPGASVTVPVPEILVVEGVSAGRACVRPRVSCLCWVEGPDAATRLERAVARDGPRSRPELSAWQRFEQEWFAVDDTRAHADVLIRR